MRSSLLFALLVALSVPAAAQPTFSLAGTLGVPQRQFDDALGGVGGGVAATFLYQIPRTPLALGVEGTALLYGHERRREPLSTTIPDVTVDVVTSNNLLQGLGVVRVQRPDGRVRPYVDGLVGVNYLVTQTQVQEPYYDEAVFSSVNYDDAALALGAGVGLQVQVYEGYGPRGRPVEVMVDARVRYLSGGEASYLGRGDIERYRDGTYDVFPRTSRTDVLLPQLGVTWRF